MQGKLDPHARLWLPPLALSGCVRAAVLRDTRGAGLAGDALLNHFPATPLMSLIWWLQGRADVLDAPGFAPSVGSGEERNDGVLDVAGPFSAPCLSRCRGDVHVMQLLFQPDALQALTGIEPAALLNRVRPPQGLLPPDWLTWADAVAAAPDDDARLCLVESFLLPRWQAVAAGRPSLGRYRAWAEHLALRAATSAAGRSVRQAERRIKAWAGLPMRELRALSRAEEAFLATGAAQGTQRWADVAAEHGYADQSHLCRETRRITGFSPAELERRVRQDPSFWAYRLWL